MTYSSSPDTWSELDTLTTKRAIIQILMFYTTMMWSGFDLTFDDNYLDKPYQKYYLQKSDPVSQVRELADGTDARFVCDRSGHFEVHMRPDLMPIGERGAATRALTFQDDDIKRYSYTRQQWRPVETLECRGFSAGLSGNQPLFSRWPGLSPGQGKEADVVERLIADGQDDLNLRCGRRGAAADGIYVDVDGALQYAFDLELVLRGSYDCFDIYSEYLEVDLVTQRRQHDLSEQLFVLQSVDVSYNEGTAETTVHLKTATNGATGETYIPESETDVPPYTPPIQTFPVENPVIPETPGILPAGVPPLRIWGISTSGDKIFYSSSYDYTTASVVYALADASGNVTGTYLDALSDPWDYARRFVLTTNGLYKVNDLFASPDSWTLVASNTTITGTSGLYAHRIIMSINRTGYMVLAFGRFCTAVSFDYGASFTRRNITGGAIETVVYSAALGGEQCAIALSQNNNPGASNKGWVWAGYANQAFPNSYFYIYLSKDWGLTWVRVATVNGPAFGQTLWLHIPYKREGGAENTDDNSQYVIAWGNIGIYRVTAGGSVATLVAPSAIPGSTATPTRSAGPYSITSFTFDGNYLASVGAGGGGIASAPVLWKTDNGGGTWTAVQQHGSGNTQTTGANGWPNNRNYLIWWGKDAHVYYTLDRGATYNDIIGNLVALGVGRLMVVEWDLDSYI